MERLTSILSYQRQHGPTRATAVVVGEREEVTMKRLWLVPLSGALVTVVMAASVDTASAYRAGVYRGGVARAGVARAGVYRGGVARAGIYRGGVYGTRYGYYRPGLRAAAAGLAVGAAAASTAAYYGDGTYYDSGYYNDGTYATSGYYGDGISAPTGYYNRYYGRSRDTAYANWAGDRTYYNAANSTNDGRVVAGSTYRPGVVAAYNAANYNNTYNYANDSGAFAGGVYRPAGSVGYGARNYSSYDYYPTRAIVTRSFVPIYSYYGPLCNPQVDGSCQ